LTKEDAAAKLQLLLMRNGALLLFPDPDLIDSDSERNVFNYDYR
jgi:hypothetical protein